MSNDARYVFNKYRNWYMRERPDWNRLGPHVPGWWVRRLRAIDPNLTLQYMPPRTYDEDGVSETIYPWGIWAVCHRVPGTRMLHKTWAFSLADRYGNPARPGLSQLRILRRTRQAARNNQMRRLDREFTAQIKRLEVDRKQKSKDEMFEKLANTMRKYDYHRGNMVSMRQRRNAAVH